MHADRVVPMEGGVLDNPIAEAKEVVIEQHRWTITEQAWDGRVLVQLATDEAEDAFAHLPVIGSTYRRWTYCTYMVCPISNTKGRSNARTYTGRKVHAR